MNAKTSTETEDLIVRYLEQHPGVTAWEISRSGARAMSGRGVEGVLFRLEEAGRVTHADVHHAARMRRLWYPTWRNGDHAAS